MVTHQPRGGIGDLHPFRRHCPPHRGESTTSVRQIFHRGPGPVRPGGEEKFALILAWGFAREVGTLGGAMRVLLIGGSGFIGPFVAADLVRREHEIAVLHRHPRVAGAPRSIIGDRQRLGESRDAIAAFAPDVVIDLILSSGRQARELIDVVRGIARRIVAISSMDVYRACGVLHGSEPGPLEPLPLTESSPLRTKLQTYPPEQMAILEQAFGWVDSEYDKIPVERTLLGVPDLPATVLRLPMVYGPGDRLRRLHPLVKRFDDGRRTIIVPLAEWRASRAPVENVAAAIALAASTETTTGRVYNVGDSDALSELAWAEVIARVAGWTGKLVALPDDQLPAHLRMPGNTAQHWIADTGRIRDELGYVEPVSRDEAVRRAIAWERTTPPSGFQPYRFDYPAEDEALARSGHFPV
jgi:nucleoside-diphosphate-sugar epimerase